MTLGLVAGLLAALLFGLGAVAQAHAARQMPTIGALARFVGHALREPVMVAVAVAYLVGFALHAVAIWLLPLYLAQATISLSMPITALAARVGLHERLGAGRWTAVGLLTVALALLALGSGDPGSPAPTPLYAVVLWAGVVVLLLIGRRASDWPGAALGCIAGVCYTGSAVAVRGVGLPVTPTVAVIALSVPALGVIAFWIYSKALDRAGVAAVTGPVIVLQTFLPAALGVILLGDGVRSWPLALTGLVVATAATVVLSRDEQAILESAGEGRMGT